MLRCEVVVTNQMRTYRLYTGQCLQVRTKNPLELPRRDSVAPQVPERPMQRWPMDFVSNKLADCSRFRVLNMVDDCSRFCSGKIVHALIPEACVTRFLDDLAQRVGLSQEMILDSDPKGTRKAMFDWSERADCGSCSKRNPMQNALVESFKGKVRDKCLILRWFWSLRHARQEIHRWRNHYNPRCPHSALEYQSPTEFLMNTTARALSILAVCTLPLDISIKAEKCRSSRP